MSFLKEVKLGDLLRKKIVTETTYNSGRKVKEDGYLSGLGVNHKCSCRDVLSLGDVFERNWVKQKDSMGSETQYLEGLGTYDNLPYSTLLYSCAWCLSDYMVGEIGCLYANYAFCN